MGMLDKDRPRGLRVPSLSSFRSKHKSPDPSPTIHLPSPSQLSNHADSIPVSSSKQLEKALPPHPLHSPPQQTLPPAGGSYPSPPPQTHSPQPVPGQNSNPVQSFRNNSPPNHGGSPSYGTMPRPTPPSTSLPPRRPLPGSATAPAPAPVPAQTPVYAPVPVAPVNPTVTQQRTPPLSDGEPEQRRSNGTGDSLESFIPDPEPEPELNSTIGTPNETGSSEDDRPWTPPEVEPVVVPLNKMHYSCYQEHRAMPAANNVWHSLPCMTCHKFDREIRHRCVFCCLRVCADCYEALKKVPRRSLHQLMETITVVEDMGHKPSATAF
ncbi:hypothetical protein BJX61DRAFT_479244 [Aspergillus egyptiacus]|nr:hypothetical protein BJX61DRAFT_479244 [Aspergillus egyptiacus]